MPACTNYSPTAPANEQPQSQQQKQPELPTLSTENTDKEAIKKYRPATRSEIEAAKAIRISYLRFYNQANFSAALNEIQPLFSSKANSKDSWDTSSWREIFRHPGDILTMQRVAASQSNRHLFELITQSTGHQDDKCVAAVNAAAVEQWGDLVSWSICYQRNRLNELPCRPIANRLVNNIPNIGLVIGPKTPGASCELLNKNSASM